jgi:hypothetical protein
MATKVYVVERGVYTERGIVGIYSTAERAMKEHPAPGESGGPPLRSIPGQQTDPTRDRVREGGWQEVHPGHWDNGFDFGWAMDIIEFEVDS